MARDAVATRTKILDAAHALVLARGYAATSVDLVLARAEVTKGAFFHHFASKDELARALVARYAEAEQTVLVDLTARVDRLSPDPLQQVLLMLRLLAEMFDAPIGEHPGCLFASFCYESGVVSKEVIAISRSFLDAWRAAFAARLTRVAPGSGLDPAVLADMPMTIIEGAFVLARTRADPSVLAAQLRALATLLERVFAAPKPASEDGAAPVAPRRAAGRRTKAGARVSSKR